MRTGATTREYSGNTTFPRNDNRLYFFIAFNTLGGTIQFGDEGGKIQIDAGGHYNPPIGAEEVIYVESSGTYVVHTDGHAE